MIPCKSKMKKQEIDKIVLHMCHVRPFSDKLICDSTYTRADGAPIVVGHCTHLKQNMQKSS